MSKDCCCNHEEHKHLDEHHHEHHHSHECGCEHEHHHEHHHSHECGCEHEHHHEHHHSHECGCEHEHHHSHECGCEHEHHHEHHHSHECGCEHEHGCGCGCHHEHHNPKIMYIRIGLSVLLSVLGLFLNGWVAVISFIAAYIVIGYDILIGSVKDIFKYHVLGENLLMTIASLGALALGEYIEAVAVMLLYQIGEMLQDSAVEKSRSAISALTSLRSETVMLENADGSVTPIAPENLKAGDIFVVKPGELITVDGVILSGSGEMDTKALTGESLPVYKEEGSEVIGGTTNLNGFIRIEAKNSYLNSTVAKILRLVEESESRKSPAESFIRKFAKIYTPIVFIIAAFVAFALPLILGESFSGYIYSALVFLTVSCPCAFVISVPLTYFAGIGGASKKGVLIKGANYIDILAKADTFVFDKTGTLTEGTFSVTGVYPQDMPETEFLRIIAAAESVSNHPIAKAICAYADESDLDVTDVKELAGRGVCVKLNDQELLVGNKLLMDDAGIQFETCKSEGSIVYAALSGKYIGAVSVNTVIRKEAPKALSALRSLGVRNISMLTGDTEAQAASVASQLGIISYKAGLLPEDKVNAFNELKGNASVFVGDGINDAPVLTVADIGIAMGGIGSDSALEASDVVIMDDNLSRIADGVAVSRKTKRIAMQNVILSLAVKIAVMALGLFGMMWLWLSIIADVGVCMIAILNSLRALKNK